MKLKNHHTISSSSKCLSPKVTTPFFSPANIQPKITIGQPDDKYEQEADAMADKVMRMPQNTPAVQTKCAGCEQEEQVQPKWKRNFLSLKSMIQKMHGKEEELQTKPMLQKMDSPEEETLQTKPLMMKSEGGGSVATPALTSQLNSSKGGGSPLPASTNQFMSTAIGSDFSNVRVHTGSNAIQMNQGLNARAFTHGSDVYFNKGEYSPSSSGGRRLLGHELTHVVQQNNVSSLSGPSIQRIGFGESLYRLFGGGTFSDDELLAYLNVIDQQRIEGNNTSDNKARAIVGKWRNGDVRFNISPTRAIYLIKEMQDGPTLNEDENAILQILEGSGDSALQIIFGSNGVSPSELNSDFQGGEWEQLQAFYANRFEGGMAAVLRGTVRARNETVTNRVLNNEATVTCTVMLPEQCGTYGSWVSQFTGLPTFSANDFLPINERNRLNLEAQNLSQQIQQKQQELNGLTGNSPAVRRQRRALQRGINRLQTRASNTGVGRQQTVIGDSRDVTPARQTPRLHESRTARGTDTYIDVPAFSWIQTHLPANLVETAYQLGSDCADIGVILRHVWLSAHRRTELYNGLNRRGNIQNWLIGDALGRSRSQDIRRLILNEVSSRTIAGMPNPYQGSNGQPLLDFQSLQSKLRSGDMLVWEHQNAAGGRTGGHTHTIMEVARDANNRVERLGVLQGNQPIGLGEANFIRSQDSNAPSVKKLRDAPGRRIETSNLTQRDFNDHTEGARQAWHWHGAPGESRTILVAAGPPVNVNRPSRPTGQAQNQLTDWNRSLQRAATVQVLQSIFEAALLEVQTMANAGQAITENQATSFGQTAGERLWSLAQSAQDLANDSHFRPLHNMRLMLRELQNSAGPQHATFGIIDQAFNVSARGGTTVSFANAQTQDVKVLLTGFDPFQSRQVVPDAGVWNPSGTAVLALDQLGTLRVNSNTRAWMQGMVFPVSYDEFRSGFVERMVQPHLNDVDAVITVSLDGNISSNQPVRLERYAVGMHNLVYLGQNIRTHEERTPRLSGQQQGAPVIESNAPLQDIAQGSAGRGVSQPTIGTDISLVFQNLVDANNFRRVANIPIAASREESISSTVVINRILQTMEPSINPESTAITFRLNGQSFSASVKGGPGGSYLSNEVSYRVLRSIVNRSSDTQSFHVHVQDGGVIPQQTGIARRTAIGQGQGYQNTIDQYLEKYRQGHSRTNFAFS